MNEMLLSIKGFVAQGVTVQCLGDAQCETGLPKVTTSDSNVRNALQITFGVIGAIAVIIIILAALRYVTARGNPQEAASARQTIIFALVGLVIAVSAEAIVTFVLKGL
jgi:hypothetical protein